MEKTKNEFSRLNDIQKKIALGVLVLAVLMILFPPKAISAPSMWGGIQSQHYGYVFLFSDPAAQAHGVNDVWGLGQMIQVHIEWGRLLIQLLVLGVVGFFAIKSQDSKNRISLA